MTTTEVKNQYLTTIGIECHVQLKTKSKLFASEENDARGKAPNTVVGHVSFGMPGALPVLNKHAVELAAKAAFALNTEPQKFSKFDRKHYFYPDLPKGYQISQFEEPIVLGGYVDIVVDGESKKIGITRAHMEEDAGKSTHPAGKDYSLVDLNRAGTPLIEIVSEPDMHSAAEARAFAKALHLQMKYADISEADLYHGNMRFDVNVSVSKDHEKLGTRSETKNLNSFKAVEKAVEFEVNRQIELLEKGGEVVQETRGWDDAKQKTFSQRTKEDAHDYRYMPEPDVPPIVLTDQYIAKLKKTLPKMPQYYREIFKKLDLDLSVSEGLISNPEEAKLIVQLLSMTNEEHARRVALWLTQLQGTEESESENVALSNVANLPHENLIKLSEMVSRKELSSTNAKAVFLELVKNGGDPSKIAESFNLLQVSDKAAIEKIVAEVVAENEKAAAEVKNGEMKVVGFLVGQVMKKSKGQANPEMAQSLIKKILNS